MNDSELEACLRALRPVAPSSQLDQKVADDLAPAEAGATYPRSGALVRPQNSWFASVLPRLLRDVTAACLGAAAAFMSLAYLHRIEHPTLAPAAAPVAVAVPVAAPVAVERPAPAAPVTVAPAPVVASEVPLKVTTPIVQAVETALAKTHLTANEEILMASNTVTSPTLNAVAAASEAQSNTETTNELVDSEDTNELIDTDSGPAREIRYSYRETHAWQDARTGARIVLEVPREDVYLQPVSLQ